jgi:hypothetical protein
LRRLSGLIAVALTLLRQTLTFLGITLLERLSRTLGVLCGHLMGSPCVAVCLRLLLVLLLSFLHVCSFHRFTVVKAALRPPIGGLGSCAGVSTISKRAHGPPLYERAAAAYEHPQVERTRSTKQV